MANFDNIFFAFLSQFQMITKDSWSPIMLNMMDVNYKFIAILYCVVIILLTSDFIMNLIIGVFCDVFKQARLEQEK